jgi:AcrR family transcriptional regulator
MSTKDIKRQEILKAAMELFARKGFRGTTTRDLAAQADVNEAIIFRHFLNKTELYRAILEEKAHQARDEHYIEVERMAQSVDPRTFLEFLGNKFFERHEQDSTFMRLLLFSALEGHELAAMFLDSMAARDPMVSYIERQMAEGRFRRMDPYLASRAFLGMFVSHIQIQEIFGQKKNADFSRTEVVKTFVSIFLAGMKSPEKDEIGQGGAS